MAILFVAAEALELIPLAERLTGRRPLKWPLDYAEEGVWQGKRYLLVANGPGPRLAAQCVEVAVRATTIADLSSSRLEAVVSVGLCGGLVPSLQPFDIVVGSEVLELGSNRMFTCNPVEFDGTVTTGRITSGNRVIVTPAEKQQLVPSGGVAVEMEAAGVAEKTTSVNLPFCCIKVVSDGLNEGFVMDFNSMRTTEGRFSRGKIVGYALTHPSVIPRLLGLRRRSRKAAGALGAFVASCRFQFNNTPSEQSEVVS
jgi:adenosylhomocysteine nucleosidase